MRAASGSTCHLARDHTAVERLEEHGMVGWWHPSTSAFACALAHGLGLWHLLIEAESALLLKGGCGMGSVR